MLSRLLFARGRLGSALLISGLFAAASIVPLSASARMGQTAKNAPIRVGFLAPQTGFLAQPGKDMLHGFKLFLNEHHDEIDGHKVKLYVADTQAKPAIALSQLRKLVEQDHIELLLGPLSAAVGSALEPFINAHKLPTIYPIVSSDNITQKKMSPYIIRTGWSSGQDMQPFGEYAYKHLGFRKIVTIGYAFSFGYQIVAGFQQTFQQAGGKVIEKLWPPISEQDYSAYISKIMAAHPQAVFAVFSGGDAVRFLKQWRSFGVKIPLLAAGNMTDWSSLPGEGNTALGVITALHYSADLKTPVNERFVAAYKKLHGHPPSYYAEGCYTAGLFLQEAMKATGGDIGDKAAFLNALKQAQVNAPRGHVRLGPWQNPIQNTYIMKVVKQDGHLANKVIYTYHNVSQFWHYNPAWYLSQPTQSRTFPKCNDCKG